MTLSLNTLNVFHLTNYHTYHIIHISETYQIIWEMKGKFSIYHIIRNLFKFIFINETWIRHQTIYTVKGKKIPLTIQKDSMEYIFEKCEKRF
jgi:hypothetical protein